MLSPNTAVSNRTSSAKPKAKGLKQTERGNEDTLFSEVIFAIRDSGMTTNAICSKSGVTGQTLKNWLDGTTRRPQLPTIRIVLKVLGYELKLVRVH